MQKKQILPLHVVQRQDDSSFGKLVVEVREKKRWRHR
jgi:hypothetical protein